MTKIESLVIEFADNVCAQSECIQRGDATTGNKHARKYIRALERLREFGDEGRDALAPLMHDSRDDVRLMAAVFLLRHRHAEARAVLETLASANKGLASFGADQALKRWDEGTWDLDPIN